jgi:hypothetical protein
MGTGFIAHRGANVKESWTVVGGQLKRGGPDKKRNRRPPGPPVFVSDHCPLTTDHRFLGRWSSFLTTDY